MPDCTLCSLPVGATSHTASDVDGEFCCRGCLEIARSLDDIETVEEFADSSGASAAADEQEGATTAEDQPTAAGTPTTAGEPGTATSQPAADGETAFLHVDGMHCSTCERFLETVAADEPGIQSVEASYATETVRVEYDPESTSIDAVTDALSVAGYTASDREDPDTGGGDELVRFLVGGGFFGMMAMVWYVLFLYPTYFGAEPLVNLGGLAGSYLFAQLWVFASVVLFYTGLPILRGAYVSLRAGQPNMDLLIALAAGGSYAYSTVAMLLGRTDLYFDVTIAVVLVVVAGGYYESRIKARTTGLLSDLTTASDRTVRRASGETVAEEEVEPYDRLLVRPGERIPFDGAIVEGSAAVDEALVTGESIPATKREGDEVRGGTLVTDAPIVVEVGPEATSTLDTIVRLLWDIQSSRTGVQRFADRLATVFVPLVLTVALLAGGGRLLLGAAPVEAALVALTVVIVSCPCAFGLATPLAVAAGIRDGARRGIVVLTDAVFEDGTAIETVVLDKTGTLTDGEMRVVDATTEGAESEAVLQRAAALERAAAHPIAEAIVDAAESARTTHAASTSNRTHLTGDDTAVSTDGGVDIGSERAETGETPTNVEVLDRGVSGRIAGQGTLVGHRSLFEGDEWTVPESLRRAALDAEHNGAVPVLVGWENRVRGVLVVGDEVRDGWQDALSTLADQGHRIVVLTGDSADAARQFEASPSVDEVFAGVPPEAKAETVRRIAASERVAMVGDGSNDAPALAAADIGISMATGTAIAADAADAVLLEDRLAAVPELFAITDGTNRRIKQNLGWALLYNGVAIPLAISGALNPLFAALAMATSSLLVVTNSSRSTIR